VWLNGVNNYASSLIFETNLIPEKKNNEPKTAQRIIVLISVLPTDLSINTIPA
jgi:hypothetical protein